MKLQNILGISAGFHDAAACVIDTRGDILYASSSERYSKQKNDANLHHKMFWDIAPGACHIDHIAYYERPWMKQLRRLRSGEGIDWSGLSTRSVVTQQLQGYFSHLPITCYNHHLSHAAGGFQTSPFDRATVVVIDAIGEFDTVTIWGAEYQHGRAKYTQLWRQGYPHSIGLFYSAITDRVGLHPMDEEYITMGMSAYGKNKDSLALYMEGKLVEDLKEIRFQDNLHAGVAPDFMWDSEPEDIAGAAQSLVEDLIYAVMERARAFNWSPNLVYQGGVALNCLANRNLGDWFDRVWIMPAPGDAGSSLGAAALAYGGRVNWQNAFLGHEIPGPYPVEELITALIQDKIVGVASGRAEFGPRALGNRSLLADPRGAEIKDKVNEIKRRQKFRPFAPVVLEEHADQYFDFSDSFCDTRYMQVVGRCRHPDLYPAITHVDGTSRIQTVPADGSGIRSLLEAWYARTGCPMLLNTSLNIRGEPMVNDRADADRFEQQYGVKVCS